MRGFSLIEILLSIAAIAIISGIGAPIYFSFQQRNDLDISANEVIQTLRRAQTLACAVKGDSDWGVALQNNQIVLFKGSAYSTRDAGFDEIFIIPKYISSPGDSQIVFKKFICEPYASGQITLTLQNTNETRTIAINSKGMVQ